MRNQMELLQSQGKRTEIDSETFSKIIRQTKELGTKSILFIGGEPLLRKDLLDLVKQATNYELNTIIVTNGLLLDEDKIQASFNAGVNWLSISLDAACERLFSQIRGENTLGKVIQNIETLNRLKVKHEKDFPKVVSVCTIMNDNLEELPAIIKLCRRLKIEKLIFQPVVINNADQSQREFNSKVFIPPARYPVLDQAIDRLIGYKRASRENFDFIANSLTHLETIKKYFKQQLHKPPMPCYAGYNRLQITQDYVVYFCIPPTQGCESSFGDVSKNDLRELWYSKQARIRRRLIRKCTAPCLQWCAYRDDFYALEEAFQKKFFFNRRWSKQQRFQQLGLKIEGA